MAGTKGYVSRSLTVHHEPDEEGMDNELEVRGREAVFSPSIQPATGVVATASKQQGAP